jgi:hypothetical protein
MFFYVKEFVPALSFSKGTSADAFFFREMMSTDAVVFVKE